MDTNKFRISIYGILLSDDFVLLVESKVGESSVVNFPGGNLEWGEAPESCLIREFQEETNLSIKLQELLFSSKEQHVHQNFPNNHCHCIYYNVINTSEQTLKILDNSEILDIFWFPVSELPHEKMWKADIEFCNFYSKSQR